MLCQKLEGVLRIPNLILMHCYKKVSKERLAIIYACLVLVD